MRTRRSLLWLFILIGMLIPAPPCALAQQQSDAESEDSQAQDCSLPVAVIGEVTDPGRFVLSRLTRLDELISLAGGPSAHAKGIVQLLHTAPPEICEKLAAPGASKSLVDANGDPVPLSIYQLADVRRGDDGANPYVRPGDIINVTRVEYVSLKGSVERPSEIDLWGPMTLTLAVALVGGLSPDAFGEAVIIHRLVKNRREFIYVNFNAIARREADDVPLEPFDLVEVPARKGKANR